MQTVHILILVYDITFNDSDDGSCYAGEGCKIIAVYDNYELAKAIVDEFSPILTLAEKETTIFPIQKYNLMIKNKFGFILHDVDSDGENFKLTIITRDVIA